ncbi:FAD binding domain-containing protein [Saccharopolyspora shandongensis]|uniref:FAD binding domain-containing protein n=1 Tax=Saccharopolyspora shandongensis TaxID=418495 RepID=UPI0033CBF430
MHRDRRRWTYTSWGTFYPSLLADFGTDHYHLGEFACGVSQDADSATVRFVSGRQTQAELVVFADGITSTGRRLLDPSSEMEYSGYVGWRGTVPEHQLPAEVRSLLGNAISYSVVPHSHITLYPIPGETGTGPQDRLMNYVWYRNVPAGSELAEMLIDKLRIRADAGPGDQRWNEQLAAVGVDLRRNRSAGLNRSSDRAGDPPDDNGPARPAIKPSRTVPRFRGLADIVDVELARCRLRVPANPNRTVFQPLRPRKRAHRGQSRWASAVI